MSYPLDVAAQSAALDGQLGDDHASTIPSSFELALFNADPRSGGVELDPDGGYVRVVVANTTAVWPAAAFGRKQSNPIALPVPTGAWSDTATHWVLFDAADSTTRWFFGALAQELAIDGTELSVAAVPTLFWNTEGL